MSRFSGWLQRTVPFATDPEQVQDQLYAWSLLQAKTHGAVDPRVAMFVREREHGTDVWIVSPEAAAWAKALDDRWEPAEDPTPYGWTLLYSAGATYKDFGLKTTLEAEESNPDF